MNEQIIEFIEDKKYSQAKVLLADENPADIAEMLGEIPEETLPVIFRILPKDMASDVFVEMNSDQQEILIKSFNDIELKAVIEEMYMDDMVDVIEEMPANVVKRIIANSSSEIRASINELLKYPKDSAGSIMTIEYVDLKKDMTVSEAFAHIRKTGVDKEDIYTCYVTDASRKLIGIVSAKTLLLSKLEDKLEDIMETNVIFANTLDDKEDVGKEFEKYDLLAIPVVDKEERLVGIVTVDDAIDVLHEEAEEDFAKMAAITPSEKPYLQAGVFSIWKSRIPWLLLLMISATFTGMIINKFETALATCVTLSAFIPMLMDTGGNSGSQSSVTIIRGLSLGEIELSDVVKVLLKEFRVALLCGVTLSIATFAKVILIDRLLLNNPDVTYLVAFVVALTILVTVIVAKFVGCMLPLLADKLGFDPAVMASPFITTIVDALSLLVFFKIASAFIGF